MVRDHAPDGMLEIGRIGKPHGVKGDLMVSFTSDLEARRREGATFTIVMNDGERFLVVDSLRPQKDRYVVHFVGVNDRTAAEHLVNRVLWAAPIEEDDTLWVHELIGSEVVDRSGTTRGRCVSVLANPAHDILELSDGSLVPVTFVVSCSDGIIVIDPPEGLFDLG